MIYLDYASTTPPDPAIVELFNELIAHSWANPSSLHSLGQKSRSILDQSRLSIADILSCNSSEVIFTPSATQSNALVVSTFLTKGSHIITSSIEHPSVLELASSRKFKNQFCLIPPTETGQILIETIETAITDSTELISLHLSHNEIGVIQPLKQISELLTKLNRTRPQPIRLHIDASQAPQFLDITPSTYDADYLTLSSHKIYSLRGCALLYVRKNSPLSPLIYGGGQEKGLISGTQNVPLIHCFAVALENAIRSRDDNTLKIGELRDTAYSSLTSCPDIIINGIFEKGNYLSRIANNIHFTLPNIDQEMALILYNNNKIAISAGSACSSGSLKPSPVIAELGLASGTHIRASLGKYTTANDIKTFIQVTKSIYQKFQNP